MARQVGEQLELARREPHLASVALHAAGAQVDPHAAGLEHRGLALAGRPQLRAHPGEQLLERERLGDVVVRATVEPFDALFDRRLRGHHDHRQLGSASANRVEHLEPGAAREHQVEQHERIVAGQRLGDAGIAVVDDGGRVALGPERLLDEPGQRALVLDDQDSHLDGHGMRGSAGTREGKRLLDRLLPASCSGDGTLVPMTDKTRIKIAAGVTALFLGGLCAAGVAVRGGEQRAVTSADTASSATPAPTTAASSEDNGVSAVIDAAIAAASGKDRSVSAVIDAALAAAPVEDRNVSAVIDAARTALAGKDLNLSAVIDAALAAASGEDGKDGA